VERKTTASKEEEQDPMKTLLIVEGGVKENQRTPVTELAVIPPLLHEKPPGVLTVNVEME